MQREQDWLRYMDEPAKQLETFLQDHVPSHRRAACMVCDVLTDGVWAHLTSSSHLSQVLEKLKDNIPSPEDAMNWEKPWVEAIPLPETSRFSYRGDYLFNHLTGEQGFRHEVAAARMSAVGLAPATVPSPPPPPVPSSGSSASAAPTLVPPSQANLPGALSSAPHAGMSLLSSGGVVEESEPCGLDLWMFQVIIDKPAQVLTQHLSARGSNFICNVCEVHMLDAYEHLRSLDHYACLRRRMSFKAPPLNRVSSGPWVQKGFRLDSSGPVVAGISFNHVTGEIHGLEDYLVPSWPELR